MTEEAARTWIRTLLVAGVLLRLAIAIVEPTSGDLSHFARAADLFRELGLDAYGALNAFDPANPFDYRSYSYPPGYLPWLLVADLLDGRAFAVAAKLPPILADASIAWLAERHLRARGASSRARVAAVGLVMAGPVFVSVSAVTGQIDGVAFVPVVLAVLLWSRGPSERRAVAAGLLVGLGGLVKAVPLLFVAALLPTARNARERVLLVACAAAPLVVTLTPFLVADPRGVWRSLAYSGFPGGGGLGVLVQPELARHYISDYEFPLSSAGRVLQDGGIALTVAAFACVALVLQRRRAPAPEAALAIGLTLLVFAVNFYEQYLLWCVPFALVCGRLRLALAVQLVMVPYLLVAGTLPESLGRLRPPRPSDVFLTSIVLLVTVLAAGWARELRRVLRLPPAEPA